MQLHETYKGHNIHAFDTEKGRLIVIVEGPGGFNMNLSPRHDDLVRAYIHQRIDESLLNVGLSRAVDIVQVQPFQHNG